MSLDDTFDGTMTPPFEFMDQAAVGAPLPAPKPLPLPSAPAPGVSFVAPANPNYAAAPMTATTMPPMPNAGWASGQGEYMTPMHSQYSGTGSAGLEFMGPPSYAAPVPSMDCVGHMNGNYQIPTPTMQYSQHPTPVTSYVAPAPSCGPGQQPTVVFIQVQQPQCWSGYSEAPQGGMPQLSDDHEKVSMQMAGMPSAQPSPHGCWSGFADPGMQMAHPSTPGAQQVHHMPPYPPPPAHPQPQACWGGGPPDMQAPPPGGWPCFSGEQRRAGGDQIPGGKDDKSAVELLEKTLQDALGIERVKTVATPARATPPGARSGAGGAGGRGAARDVDRMSPKNSDKSSPKGGSANVLEDMMRRKGVDEAWSALEDMQRRGVTTDKFTVSRMLMKTLGDGRSRLNPVKVYRGIALVERFIELQPKDVDQVLINALLDTCCRLKDLSRLEATVQLMRNLKVAPSPVTLGILVKAYGQAGDLQKVLQVWEEMENQRGQANAVTYGCMIDACVKCGNLDKAVEIFDGMRESGKHRNTILYTTLIKGYGLEKDLEKVMHLFREMPHEGVPYNTITYNSAIDACVKCGDLSIGEQLLNEMRQHEETGELKPDLITYSTLLKGYCHVGELEKALHVVEAIKASGLQCDELVYNTLMHGCVKANNLQVGAHLFEEMVKSGMRPSAITHSILVRLYQRAGYEDSASASNAVAELYQHHGIERPNGSERNKGQRRGSGPPSGSPANNSPAFSPAFSPAYNSTTFSPAQYSPSMTPQWYHNSPAIGFGALSLS